MRPQEILKNSKHRPFPIPEGSWIIYQEWHKVLFIHWPVPLNQFQPFIPKGLVIETFKGTAWISAVIFWLTNVRPRFLPAFPPVSNAVEVNFRTYVQFRGKPGIYFLSMELGKYITSVLAGNLTGLPYRQSVIEYQPARIQSYNKATGDKMDVEFRTQIKIIKKSEHEKWLTERYALFQDKGSNKIIEYNIHHYEWPLYKGGISRSKFNYTGFGKLIQPEPSMVHFSPGVEVLTWGRRNHRYD